MNEKRCENCSAVYRIKVVSVPFRDSDFIDCRICGVELIRWNGGAIYRAELVEEPPTTDEVSTSN